MAQKIPPSIVLIGAGNVGTQLGKRLHKRKQNISQVFSRQSKKAKRLAAKVESNWTSDLNSVVPNADLYILAVHDDAISEVARVLAKSIQENSLVVHTSGSTPSSVLQPYFKHFGVFYPLQTFSLDRKPKWANIPICLDAHHHADLQSLKRIAKRVSKKTYTLNDEQRSVVHVAAVFANNFPNCLFTIAQQILESEDLPFELIRPLILETAQKIKNSTPHPMQTGPAARGDRETIERHLAYLEEFDHWKQVYQILTDQIQSQTSGDRGSR